MPTNPHPIQGENFEQWFHRQKFEHFKADEFTNYFAVNRRGVQNEPPPRSMWAAIVPTLRIVDALRKHLGRSITILSSYRSPAYNAAISGAATKSYHMKFLALDIAVAGHSPRTIFELLKKWRTEGKFTGGLGLYSTFVHIDTRGTNATW
jgi:uncharacterized protein YcbK (DUF882 family)